jgi:predicted transcriptional regulator
MKFEWDTARQLLQAMEDSPHSRGNFDFSALNLDEETLNYHLRLIMQRGLIEATEVFALSDRYPTYMVRSMTLDGHEFLDLLRNDTMWSKIKSTVKEKGLSLSFDAIKACAVWLAHQAFS